MWLLVLFLAVPLIEIGLFVQVGGLIGLWPTLAIVVLTAVIGTSLMRAQGALAMNQIRSSFDQMNDPTEPLAHGAMILIAGVLLLTPGFFTDFVGLLLLFPPFRAVAFRWAKSRVRIQTFSTQQTYRAPGDDVIDGDFTEVRPDPDPSLPPSGWTKH
ncbi:FxsA family protein [Actibacterium sp.]|uniref:FxsA family protein n=1 Tax=Actibacterium sp. TaxID=1872125 RepID=UPI003562360F